MMLCGLVYAQDLEDDFLKISAKDVDASIEDDYSEEEAALDEILSTYNVSDKRVRSKDMNNQEIVNAKREQLGIIVRRAYYQKLTAPKWASVISSDSWRDSFLKWRYYAQLRNYISNIDNDLTYFKVNKPLVSLAAHDQKEEANTATVREESDDGALQEESLLSNESEARLEEVIASIEVEEVAEDIATEETGMPEEEDAPANEINVQSFTSVEEDWESQENVKAIEEAPVTTLAADAEPAEETVVPEEVEEIEEVITFSLDQLTLSDDIVSERQEYELALAEAARKDSLAEAAEAAIALAKIDEELAEREREKEKALSAERAKSNPPKENVVIREEQTSRPVVATAQSKPTTVATPAASTRTTSQNQASQPIANTATTYTPDVRTNRTVTAASVVTPSTAPRSISAGRQAQTAGFVKRKGQLSWPVMSGQVTDRYGIRANAAARGLKPRNNGIDLSCPTSTSILSVHSGTVMMVAKQAPYDHIVTVKHGDYTSAYYYINSPAVKVGDVVAMGQRLGRLIGGDGEARFHFELWEGQNKVDPEIWLAPK